MKKIVFTMADIDYEKFRLQALLEEKSISALIEQRLSQFNFHPEVIESYDRWLESNIQELLK